jgi:hypothetical protein
MITYTQLYKRAADEVGISTTTASQALTNIQQDINQGLRLFKNAARRYWTRKEVTTNLVTGQQYYTFPEDMVRITTVRCTTGSLVMPVTLIDSEELWNRLNLIPAMTVGIPTTGFVRGKNELGLYPIPSTDTANGLIVSYEPRLPEMNVDDITSTVTLTANSTAVLKTAGTDFSASMVGSYLQGPDGNWYPIAGFTDATHITLENIYQGATVTGASVTIGQVPDIPEDYHLGLVYFACYNYYLKRKDMGTAASYKSLYDDLFQRYEDTYAAKTTGRTQSDLIPYSYDLFGIPPMNMSA